MPLLALSFMTVLAFRSLKLPIQGLVIGIAVFGVSICSSMNEKEYPLDFSLSRDSAVRERVMFGATSCELNAAPRYGCPCLAVHSFVIAPWIKLRNLCREREARLLETTSDNGSRELGWYSLVLNAAPP